MVPGDIDLTENLDFRKSRKANIPKIPWDELHDNFISEDIINTVSLYTFDDNTFRITATSSSTTTSNNISTTSMHITYDDTRTDSFYIQYDNNGLFWHNIPTNSSTYTINANNYYPKKDIFGNIIKGDIPIPELCYYDNKQEEKIPRLPYHDEPKDCIPCIPWDDVYTPFCDFYKKKVEQICYLDGMSYGERRDYLRRNTIDNSKYLTDMHHIRIRDAIIE